MKPKYWLLIDPEGYPWSWARSSNKPDLEETAPPGSEWVEVFLAAPGINETTKISDSVIQMITDEVERRLKVRGEK